MAARRIERIELGMDVGAAATYAAATVFVLVRLGAASPYTAASAAIAFAAAFYGLRSVELEQRPQPIRVFRPADVEPYGVDELVLADADRLQPESPPPDHDALLLDDELATIGPEARVVRLFDPAAMPAPGALDRHLVDGRAGATPGDASQALYDALDELRRSIR